MDDTAQQLNAAAARRILGVLVGGTEGDDLIATANEWFAREELSNPDKLAAMMASGFSPPTAE